MLSGNRTPMPGDKMPPLPLASHRLSREEFGKRLDNLRLRRGWSQSDLGRHSGLTRGSISEYIKGRAFPSTLNLKRLADALSVKPEDLLPNVILTAAEDEQPAMQMKVLSSNPGMALVNIHRMLPTELASKLMSQIAEYDAAANAG